MNFTYLDAGLPNLEGNVGAVLGGNENGFGSKTGVFTNTAFVSTTKARGNTSNLSGNNIIFNASIYNSIYGKSSTVQPRSIHLNNIIKF